jgi:hypothetical protein
MNRKTLMIAGIGGGALLALLILGGVLIFGRGKKEAPADSVEPAGSGGPAVALDAGGADAAGVDAKRQNILRLAREYIEAGEFRRALDLLDGLFIEDPQDPLVRELRDRALREQHAAEQAAADTAAAAIAAAGRNGGLSAAEQAERRRAADEERLRQEADAASRAAAEAERKAAADAEAARRRAEEEELARQGRELQARMRAVNDLVSQGRAGLRKDDLEGAAQAFEEARSKIPPGETRFEAQKLADMAEGYYDY